MIPNENCYCEIDPNIVDQWGIPVLRFHWKWSDNEIKMAKDMQETYRAIVEAAGGTYLGSTREDAAHPYGLADGGVIIHEVGTARMGEHPATSVSEPVLPDPRCKKSFRDRWREFRHECRQEPNTDDYGADVARVGLFAGSGEERESVRTAMPISRRDILKSLSLTAVAGSVLRVIPMEAAEYAHRMVAQEKAGAENHDYTPKFFSPHAYQTLRSLCNSILPPDEDAKGAIEAGAPEFIDLITSENTEYQVALGGGLMWLDNTCIDRYGKHTSIVCRSSRRKFST